MNTILLWLGVGFVSGFLLRALHRKLASKSALTSKGSNINKGERVMRGVFGIALLVLYTFVSHPIVLFFAGFTLFQAIFSWCGLYALLGKNTCPLE